MRFVFSQPRWGYGLSIRAHLPTYPPDPIEVLKWFRELHPYYASRLCDVSNWAQIRPLGREDLALIAPLSGSRALFRSCTSGTSGVRVSVINDESERAFRRVLLHRPFEFYDLPRVVRQITFADTDPGREIAPHGCVEYHSRRYWRWVVSAAATPECQLASLKRVRPHILSGIPSAMVRLAEAAGDRARQSDLRIISTGGEWLSLEWRSLLTETFAAPVLDRYGATETGAIAWQCPYCGSYHANADEMIIEPTCDGVLVTPLFLTTQPLLRYRLADTLCWTNSAGCRIQLPTLRITEARRDDWLYDGTDGKVSPLAFQFERFERLQAWMLHQSSDGSITVHVTWAGRLEQAHRFALLAEARQVVQGRRIRVVDDLAQCPPSGKFKRVVSDYMPGPGGFH